MKKLKYLLPLILVAVLMIGSADTMAKRVKLPQIYMFGFSASFSDSIVYFTDVQTIENAWIDDSDDFLEGRNIYASQLKDFLADEMQQPNRVCIVMYAKKREDVEKKFLQMKRLYTVKAKDMYDVRYLNTQEFRFQRVDLSPDTSEQ